jgi:hypothetical protein
LIGDAFRSLFVMVRDARARSDRFERFAAMSDAELERQGLKREEVGREIFAVWLYA